MHKLSNTRNSKIKVTQFLQQLAIQMARSTVPLKRLRTLSQPRNTVQFQLHVQLSIAIKEKLALSNQPLEQSGGKRVVKQAINSTQFPRFSETKQVKVARLESILYTKVSLPPSSSVGLHPLGARGWRKSAIHADFRGNFAECRCNNSFLYLFPERKFRQRFVRSFVQDKKETSEAEGRKRNSIFRLKKS